MDCPFKITIYDKAFKRVGFIGNPIYASFTPRFCAQGSGEIQVHANDPYLADLLAAGSRLRVEYRGQHLMSGMVRNPQGGFDTAAPVTFQLQDDWRLLRNTLGWVIPRTTMPRSSGELQPTFLEDDGQAFTDAAHDPGIDIGTGYYVFPDGSPAFGGGYVESAESAIKDLAYINMVRRMGRPVTVAANLDRGGNALAAGVLPAVRFDPLDEAVAPLLEWSGLGLRLWQDDTNPTINLDVWEPAVWAQTLTVESGIVGDGTWSKQYPEATRAVVGGPGELAARAFRAVNDGTGLEAEFNDIVEVFREGTGAPIPWPDAVADTLRVAKYYLLRPEVDPVAKTIFTNFLDTAGGKALSDGAPTSGLSMELSETETFYFGGDGGIQLGDIVTASSRGIEFTDRVTEASLSFDASDGLVVTPRIGDRRDDPDVALALAINALARAVGRFITHE